jgi:predicted nucleotidyltransferase
MDFEADFVFDIVSRQLPEAGVNCLMIGGHAVNHYGFSRATQDIDFMIAVADEATVRRVMSEAGFTNIASHEAVTFFNRPGSALRVDFVKVDGQTMETLYAAAVTVDYFEGRRVRVPQLRDLLAMKLFALKSGNPKREDKDFPDVVHLVIENGLSLETDLRPLCERFATPALYERLCARIRELQRD